MLMLQDVVIMKSKDGKVASVVEFDKPYMEYGQGDPTEVKDATSGGNKVGTRVVPRDEKSVHDTKELFGAAVAWVQAQYPKIEDPVRFILSKAASGITLDLRADVRPPVVKPVDQEKATLKAAKNLVAAGKFPDIKAALEAIAAL